MRCDQRALCSSVRGTTDGAVESRLYHETRDEHHLAARRCAPRCRRALHRSGVVRGSRWIACSRGCGSRPAAPTQLTGAGRVHPPRRRRRERADRPRRQTASIRAFHNVCRHRGTRLCTTDDGAFHGSIQCPYHAWTYELDGRLLGAPQMDEVEGFDRARLSAARGRVRGLGRPHLHQPVADAPDAAGARSSAICRSASRRGAMQDLRLVAPHRVRRRAPTGSWSCRTTTSACTAR